MSFLQEIKRRKVFRVAVVYAVVAWLIIQVVGEIGEPLGLPSWFDTFVIVLLAIGFPIALILSWAFDLTSDGIRKEKSADTQSPSAPSAAVTLTYVIQGLVLLAVGFLVFDQYFADGDAPAPAAQGSAQPGVQQLKVTVTLPMGVRYAAGEVQVQGATLSPDGRNLVFTGAEAARAGGRLYVRPLGSIEAIALEGTEGANSVFWSPDSRQIGFFADGRLKTMPLGGDTARPVTNATGASGGTWNNDDVILASLENPGPIFRVELDGSAPVPITELDATAGETDHVWPQFLDDGRHFLYMATGRSVETSKVLVGTLESDERIQLLEGVSTFRYAAPNGIVFLKDGILQSQTFDLATFSLSGQPVSLADDALAPLSASSTGAVTYRTVPADSPPMSWIGTDGTEIRPALPAGPRYVDPVISRDGRQVAFARPAPNGGAFDIWILDIETGIPRQLTTHPGVDRAPLWSPDGQQIAYLSMRDEATGIYIRDANGIGAERLILPTPGVLWPYDWPERDKLLYFAGISGANDLWEMSPYEPDNRTLLVDSEYNEADPILSPGRDWIVYSSNDTGRYELYVTRYPPDGTKIQLTSDAGVDPAFSRDGTELYYLSSLTGELLARPVKMSVPPQIGESRLVHSGPFFFPDAHTYAVHPELDQILIAPSQIFSGDITMLLNWHVGVDLTARGSSQP